MDAASTAAVKEENIVLPDQPRRKSELEKRSDWRLPLSPEVAVLYAQDDLRQRLDMESRTEVLKQYCRNSFYCERKFCV